MKPVRLAMALLIASALHAAEVRLGPETAVSAELPGQAQLRPVAASRGEHLLIAWRDAEARQIRGVIDGNPFFFDAATSTQSREQPFIAAIGERNALVVWSEGQDLDRPVYARRISFTGVILDPPIPLGTCTWSLTNRPAGILFDESAFVVTWSKDRTILIARVSPDGVVSTSEVPNIYAGDTRPVRWNGVTNIAMATRRYVASPLVYPVQWLWVLPDFDRNVAGSDAAWSVAMAQGRQTFALKCASPFCSEIVVWQPPAKKTTFRVASGQVSDIDLVWDGGEYVAAFNDYQDGGWVLRGMRITANGDLIDASPFEIVRTAEFAAPSLAVVPDGVEIVYTRANRAYRRTLARLLSPPRRYAARH